MGDNQQSLTYRMAEVRTPHLADPDVIERLPTFRAALRFAINHSGFEQEAIAQALGIDPSCFSRMVREPRHVAARPREFPCEKLRDFAHVTGSLAAQQWLDAQVGMEPVSMRETKLQRLERECEELRATASRMAGFDRRVA